MKCVVLCAGYATRLYPITFNAPKSLLDIKGRPLLNYIMDNVLGVSQVEEIFVVTNDKFYDAFLEWKDKFYPDENIAIVNDGTKSNEDRLGALGDLRVVLNTEEIEDDLLLLFGDKLYDFKLNDIVDFFETKKQNVIGLYDIEKFSDAKNYGVLKIDDSGKIVSFSEKSAKPHSTLISPGIYIYSKEELRKIHDYMQMSKPRESPDYLIPHFMKFQNVYGFILGGKWQDITSKEIYEKINHT